MNHIHPSVVMLGEVEMGDNNEIGPFTVLVGPLKIGNNNFIGSHVNIGSLGEDTKHPRYDGSDKHIVIGNNNIIREGCVINKPSATRLTEIGNDCYLMHGSHVAHDNIIHDKVVMAPYVALGGHTRVMTGANIGMRATTHQFTVIGPYTMTAMGAVVTKNIRPFAKYIPNKPLTINRYAIEKFKFRDEESLIEDYFKGNWIPDDSRLGPLVRAWEFADELSGRSHYA